MDVQKKLDEIVGAVQGARSMPMSASCVVNRAELLAMLEEVAQALPGSLAQAQEVIGGSEQLVEQARHEADRIIESARTERGSLISDTAVARQSQDEAERILGEARKEAEEVRTEADEYVDSKLANFEVVLTKTLGSVGRGREKLLGTGQGLDEQGYEDPDFTEAPERSQDPETLRRRADDYVDAKLGAFEAVLSKTLEAVGRGRQKLHGRVATDDLDAIGGLDAVGAGRHGDDSDYLSGLADPAATAAPPQPPAADRPPPAPADPAPLPPQAAPPQPVPAQAGYDAGLDPYGYQQDPYGYQQPYPGQDPQGYQAQAPQTYQDPGYAPQSQQPYDGQSLPYGEPQPQYGGQQAQGYAQQDPYGYQQDPYAYQQDPYGNQQPYPGQDVQGYDQSGYPQGDGSGRQPPALDETSLFDTSMISVDQLRSYEQGR